MREQVSYALASRQADLNLFAVLLFLQTRALSVEHGHRGGAWSRGEERSIASPVAAHHTQIQTKESHGIIKATLL